MKVGITFIRGIFLSLIILFFSSQLWAQEQVTDGDFENGFVGGVGTSWTSNGIISLAASATNHTPAGAAGQEAGAGDLSAIKYHLVLICTE